MKFLAVSLLIMVASTFGFSIASSNAFHGTNSGISMSHATSNHQRPKLLYFDAKGAGEMSRILLNIGNIDFEDVR